jgi:hypothetical protein
MNQCSSQQTSNRQWGSKNDMDRYFSCNVMFWVSYLCHDLAGTILRKAEEKWQTY